MPQHNLIKLFKIYLELSKPRILTLVLVTTALGYYLGGKGIVHPGELAWLLLGAMLVCSGSSILNQYLERDYDALMVRTKNRPIPTGVIAPNDALIAGILTSLLGVFILYVETNILTAFLSMLTAFLYVLVYTPLKRVSWINTTIGAIPGAIPPLGGWAAATGTLNFDAGILFLIMFLWQHPHFYAIAWMCKDDYARAGFKMLPCIEPDGKGTFRQIILFSVLLLPVSVVPAWTGLTGRIYLIGAILLGFYLLRLGQILKQTHSLQDARTLLKATVYYLPILFALIIVDIQF